MLINMATELLHMVKQRKKSRTADKLHKETHCSEMLNLRAVAL